MTWKDAVLGLLLVTTVIGAVHAVGAEREIEKIKAESDSIATIRDSAYKVQQKESDRANDSLRVLGGRSTSAANSAAHANAGAAALRRNLAKAQTAVDSLPLAIALGDSLQVAVDSLLDARRSDSLQLVILGKDRDAWKFQADSLHSAMLKINTNVGKVADVQEKKINLGLFSIPVKETVIAAASLTLGYGIAKASD